MDNSAGVYQFHMLLHGDNQPVWRHILMRSDQTLSDLHYAILIAFDWSNLHLHTFTIREGDREPTCR